MTRRFILAHPCVCGRVAPIRRFCFERAADDFPELIAPLCDDCFESPMSRDVVEHAEQYTADALEGGSR